VVIRHTVRKNEAGDWEVGYHVPPSFTGWHKCLVYKDDSDALDAAAKLNSIVDEESLAGALHRALEKWWK
jgi:hypothetical protein